MSLAPVAPLTRSLPLARPRPSGYAIHVARIPAAPFYFLISLARRSLLSRRNSVEEDGEGGYFLYEHRRKS